MERSVLSDAGLGYKLSVHVKGKSQPMAASRDSHLRTGKWPASGSLDCRLHHALNRCEAQKVTRFATASCDCLGISLQATAGEMTSHPARVASTFACAAELAGFEADRLSVNWVVLLAGQGRVRLFPSGPGMLLADAVIYQKWSVYETAGQIRSVSS